MKTKNLIKVIFFLFLGANYAYAQDHAHKAPHGGMVKTAGEYHIEMVMSEGKMVFYLLDKNEKTLSNKEIVGTVTLQYEDKTSSTEKLMAMGTEQFMIDTKGKHVSTCIVTLKVKGKTVSAKFDHKDMHPSSPKDEKKDGHDHKH